MSATNPYHHNHYVPVWYQRRFMHPGQHKYHYLDLKPEVVPNDGHPYTRQALRPLGPDNCFAQDDLYTTKWGNIENTEIEQFFFGRIDTEGKRAVEYFTSFQPSDVDETAYRDLMTYMTVQKLRTPKGLGWLGHVSREQNHNLNLLFLQGVQNLFGAIWTECVWQFAEATHSPVKFIISDHPVTVYNRGCFPGSPYCIGFNDPDIRLVASHTYFPLTLEQVLILTNLSWVRNLYQSERNLRPNPKFFRQSLFHFDDIQSYRYLHEQEVLQINYITKKRALRYVAAAEKDWLYPEAHLSNTQWGKLGGGYLLMPEPRTVYMGGEVMMRFNDGSFDAFGTYGHKPWQPGYEDKDRDAIELRSLRRFQAEFAVMQGPVWRGTSRSLGRNGPHTDSDEYHRHMVELHARFKGDVKRRRK